ncbi:MAG TPA: hypothetical protein VM618_02270, partial [Acidimicrobiia bacterium]|nr:hypothetical protein [Acidimicrobiia bacterium]
LPRGRHTTFSAVLPYAVEGRGLLLFGAALHPARAWDDPYDAGDVDLVVASLTGPWQPLGRFRLGGPLDEATAARLHFDPWNTGNGLRPVGRLNDWRLPAYEGSRTGRNAVGEPAQNGANRQQV